MSDLKEKTASGAWGNCAHIPVSPEEDAEICASAHAQSFQGPVQPAPEGENAAKPKSYNGKMKPFVY